MQLLHETNKISRVLKPYIHFCDLFLHLLCYTMVNYCCVFGCSRNSRYNKHLTYYSLPKERDRQIKWLKAAGREDLIEKGDLRLSHRVCSRHFSKSCLKNRLLCPDAVPTLCLQQVGGDQNSYEPKPHDGVVCDNCNMTIVGFRYKCVTCSDYDLCQKCETLETHSHHYMVRIPKPIKNKSADGEVKKTWKKFLESEEMKPVDFSSDDEPITKYTKNYDSLVDLSEHVKQRIRKEVIRVLNTKPEKSKKVTKKRPATEDNGTNKKIKMENNIEVKLNVDGVPKLAPEFADVNNIDSQSMEFKAQQVPVSNPDLPIVNPNFLAKASNAAVINDGAMPMMHVKLSDDLSELLIEVTSTSEKTVYKYPQ